MQNEQQCLHDFIWNCGNYFIPNSRFAVVMSFTYLIIGLGLGITKVIGMILFKARPIFFSLCEYIV